MTTNTKKPEKRIGAQGLPNAARASNVLRYELGRTVYRVGQAFKAGKATESELAEARAAYQARPLLMGEDTAALATKKAKGKSKDAEEAI